MRLAGLIAAAGLSSRMGAFKPLLEVDGESVIRREIRVLRAAGCGTVAVVTGCRAEELERHVAQPGVVCLRNEAYASTQQFESAQIGLRYLAGKCETVLFCPADVPFLSLEVTRALLACGHVPCLPVHAGREGHPMVFPAAAIPDMLAYTGPRGLRGAVEACAGVPYALEVPDCGPTRDVDTPEEWEEVRKLCR